ncbi:tetratricopeptide repeat protein [Rapidithrix thailandica]|uniref:Tetratricopeptide repeat protein n=1 Tax=Rapidithrix thailandica TaxID=413964 RepID=A0AAW9S1Y0_9BACT
MSKHIAFILWVLLLGNQAAIGQTDDLNVLKAKAKANDPAALYQLGKAYEEGKVVKLNIKKALKYYKDASDLGYDSAYLALGNLYEQGQTGAQDYYQAYLNYKKAADQNNAEGKFHLARLYEQGKGINKNLNEAVRLYLEALKQGYLMAKEHLDLLPVDQYANKNSAAYAFYKAEKGNAADEYSLGVKYEKGQGVPKDLQKAFDFYKKAADKNNPKAQVALGRMYTQGIHVRQNVRQGVLYYLKAANQQEEDAITELKKYDLRSLVEPDNLDYLTYKGNQGNPISLYRLFQVYYNGIGVQSDYTQALMYCQQAAVKDYIPAILSLGNVYEKGNTFIAPDLRKSFQWYKRAAYLGNDSAQFVIGEMHALGKGTQQNMGRAVRWYLRAANGGMELAKFRLSQINILQYIDKNDLEYVKYQAEKGDAQAQLKLSKYYLNIGSSETLLWLRRAADAGIAEAQRLLGEVYLLGKANYGTIYPEAYKWFSMAAKANDLEAIKWLAYMYSNQLAGGDSINHNQAALDRVQQYLMLAQQNNISPDPDVFLTMGKAYSATQDTTEALNAYTEYINRYQDNQEKPEQLITAFTKRAGIFAELNKDQSGLTDLEAALMLIESYKTDDIIQSKYNSLRGEVYYQQGQIIFKQGNTLKACNLFQQAKKMGVQIEQRYLQTCLGN